MRVTASEEYTTVKTWLKCIAAKKKKYWNVIGNLKLRVKFLKTQDRLKTENMKALNKTNIPSSGKASYVNVVIKFRKGEKKRKPAL